MRMNESFYYKRFYQTKQNHAHAWIHDFSLLTITNHERFFDESTIERATAFVVAVEAILPDNLLVVAVESRCGR
jgi:hypothetical protein